MVVNLSSLVTEPLEAEAPKELGDTDLIQEDEEPISDQDLVGGLEELEVSDVEESDEDYRDEPEELDQLDLADSEPDYYDAEESPSDLTDEPRDQNGYFHPKMEHKEFESSNSSTSSYPSDRLSLSPAKPSSENNEILPQPVPQELHPQSVPQKALSIPQVNQAQVSISY